MLKHVQLKQRCYTQVTLLIDYNFARKLRRLCTAAAARRRRRHGNSRVFSKLKETDFCLAALLVGVSTYTEYSGGAVLQFNSLMLFGD